MRKRTIGCLVSLLLGAMLCGCPAEDPLTARDATGADGGRPDGRPVGTLRLVTGPPGSAPAGSVVPLSFELRDASGVPAEGVVVIVEADRGGGRIAPPQALSDADGQVSFAWTLGPAPVWNDATVAVAEPADAGPTTPVWVGTTLTVRGDPGAPVEPEPFGDLDAWLTEEGVVGSTEDLAFGPDGSLVFGFPGGLGRVSPEGSAARWDVTGDDLGRPLGIAFDGEGTLWVADVDGAALRRVTPEGVVETVLTEVDGVPLEGPNYVAVAPDGAILLTDPCLGSILRVDPEAGAVTHRLELDRQTQGGANGLAFDADGRLWFLTENTFLTCGHADVGMNDRLAHLFVVDVDDHGFGAATAVAEGIGHFGDGLGFDAEGNLYAVVDITDGLALAESLVLVLAQGDDDLVPFLRTTDRLFANVAFGAGEFGAGTLYVAILAVPPLTAAATRGLMRFDVGIPGAL